MAKIQLRRDTKTNWESVNPTPAEGEPCFETDTNTLKIGNGTTAYADLPAISGGGSGGDGYTKAEVDALLADKQDVLNLGNGLTFKEESQSIVKMLGNADYFELNYETGEFTAKEPIRYLREAYLQIDVRKYNINLNGNWEINLPSWTPYQSTDSQGPPIINVRTSQGDTVRLWYGAQYFRAGEGVDTVGELYNSFETPVNLKLGHDETGFYMCYGNDTKYYSDKLAYRDTSFDMDNIAIFATTYNRPLGLRSDFKDLRELSITDNSGNTYNLFSQFPSNPTRVLVTTPTTSLLKLDRQEANLATISSGANLNLLNKLTTNYNPVAKNIGTSKYYLMDGVLKLPALDSLNYPSDYVDYCIEVRLTGEVAGGANVAREFNIQLQRPDGTVIEGKSVVKVADNSLNNKSVVFETFVNGANDPFIVDGLKIFLNNTSGQTITLNGLTLLVKGRG